MAVINPANLPGNADSLKSLLRDVTSLRNTLVDLLGKLDADTGTADADYEATLTPDPLETTEE